MIGDVQKQNKDKAVFEPIIVVEDLTMAFGDNVIQRDLTFTINRGDIFIVMGGSGCGKSTLMRNLIGLQRPARGRYFTTKKVSGTLKNQKEKES